MIGFFLYLPTVIHVPHGLFVLAFLVAFIQNPKLAIDVFQQFKSRKISPVVWGLLVLYTLILFNGFLALFDLSFRLFSEPQLPYLVFLPLTLYIAKSIRLKDLKVLLYLICIESFVAWVEYGFGVTTFFGTGTGELVHQGSDLLYFKRPYGLSPNSSGLALKAFLGILLIQVVSFGKWSKYVSAFFFSVVIISFARTVLIATIVFIILILTMAIAKRKTPLIYYQIGAIVFGCGLLLLLINFEPMSDVFVKQFTRNTGQIELTGRDKIWANFLEVFYESPIFGTYSNKLMFGPYHAHNSFLQLLSSNGLLIAVGMFAFIVANLKAHNWIFIVTILIYSIAQYGVFWGISILDCFFYFFLLQFRPYEGYLQQKK